MNPQAAGFESRGQILQQSRFSGTLRTDDRGAVAQCFQPIQQRGPVIVAEPISQPQDSLDGEWVVACSEHNTLLICRQVVRGARDAAALRVDRVRS